MMSFFVNSLILFCFFHFNNLSVFGTTLVCDEAKECANETITDNEVYCRGFQSCDSSTIDASYFLSCGGEKGCEYTTINTDTGTIYCDGWLGCWYSAITVEDHGVLECRGRRACASSDITAEAIEVVCSGSHSCMSTTISSQEVICGGYFGCQSADITASLSFTADGEYGAIYSVITGTPSISTNGDFGMHSAYISSNGVNTLIITSNGYHALYNAQLDCYAGSSCDVICGEGDTCSGFEFFCYDGAECNVDCDNSCTDCPSIIDGSSIRYSSLHTQQRQEEHKLKQLENQIELENAVEAIDQELNSKIAKKNDVIEPNFAFLTLSTHKFPSEKVVVVLKVIAFLAIYELITFCLKKCYQKNNKNLKNETYDSI